MNSIIYFIISNYYLSYVKRQEEREVICSQKGIERVWDRGSSIIVFDRRLVVTVVAVVDELMVVVGVTGEGDIIGLREQEDEEEEEYESRPFVRLLCEYTR